jgi:ubiquinone/menaquinone biosynthesis C-methylase UbiE
MSKKISKQILKGEVYKDFPYFYDLLYQRFLKSIPDFVNFIDKNCPANGTILDLAAGTGEVSIPLIKKKYRVTSLDLNQGMLRQLKQKAKENGIKNVKCINKNMLSLKGLTNFDIICIRQAINYQIGGQALQKQFQEIFNSLKKGGKFIFNAPNFYPQKKRYPIITSINELKGWKSFVVELNKLEDRLLIHKQYSLIWKKKNPLKITYLVDKNSFYMFTKNEFAKYLKEVGFINIKFYSSGLNVYKNLDKTLYCVAQKT